MEKILPDIDIIARVTFYDKAYFKFPIQNDVRMSIGFEGAIGTTPSEFTVVEPMYIHTAYLVKIKYLDREFLEGVLKVGAKFCLGHFSDPIGVGEVVEIL